MAVNRPINGRLMMSPKINRLVTNADAEASQRRGINRRSRAWIAITANAANSEAARLETK
jgi:alkylhydroperoxidase/carboxymuconolactone decarboxylase family protein YurZ